MSYNRFRPDPKPAPKAKKKPKPIKKVSDKRKVDNESYLLLRQMFLQKNPICQVDNCQLKSVQCHHKKGRVGDNYLDTTTWLAVCNDHHHKIEMNPVWAKEQGYSESRLSK